MKQWQYLFVVFFMLIGNNSLPLYAKENGVFTNYIAKNNSKSLNNLFFNCVVPTNLIVTDVGSNYVDVQWTDNINNTWEYYVQPLGNAIPTTAGIITTSKNNHITTDINGNTLLPNTLYEIYVRSYCATTNSYSTWINPTPFKTYCVVQNLPLIEDFETTSKTADCWSIVDNNKDGNLTSNSWRLYNNKANAYKGDYTMFFNGVNTGKPHDDYLIAPTVNLTANQLYELTYYYKTNASANTEFEVVLSNTGRAIGQYTTVLQTKAIHKQANYVKKTLYITGIAGNVDIAWHVVNTGAATVYIDNVSLHAVGCKAPEDNVDISNILKDKATFTIYDNINTQWESTVLPANSPAPVGSGQISNNKTVTITQSNGNSLLPDTTYDFWVRANCGSGQTSTWIGPFPFRTKCDRQPLPFFEGFNGVSSPTAQCWTIIDENKDSTSSVANIWTMSSGIVYQGSQAMAFNGNTAQLPHNDWLISPPFYLQTGKKYRLKYYYRTNTNNKNDFKVWMAQNGFAIKDFTKLLVEKKNETSATWLEETLIVDGNNTEVHFAWQVTSNSAQTQVYIDNVVVQEIKNCPEPIFLTATNITTNQATLTWTDNYGVEWEYVVQKSGQGVPAKGISSKSKTQNVTQTYTGQVLQQNTEYELYVRTKCADGSFSEWTTPYRFRTICGVYQTPFTETFNSVSPSLRCWTIVDANKDATNAQFGPNIWITTPTAYEGNGSMYFNGTAAVGKKHDDWLISPKIQFNPNKTYRLKYYYRTNTPATNDYEFEVLLSKRGEDTSDFTTVIVPKQKYLSSISWKEEYVFISGVSGEINLAWHIAVEDKATQIYIDQITVEEVINCPEPNKLNVTQIESNQATLNWNDQTGGSTWEYYVQKKGLGTPQTAGTSTTTQSITVTNEQNTTPLNNNTDYEFYVRTVCGNSQYSIWNGPFAFTTSCGVFNFNFFEGFNTDSTTLKCWTVIDANNDAPNATDNNRWKPTNNLTFVYEGNQAMEFAGVMNRSHDDYLVTPTFKMKASNYILKYRYLAQNSGYTPTNDFELLLSTQGVDVTKFTHTIKPMQRYISSEWVEEIVFFTGIAGDVNLAWHLKTQNGARDYTLLRIDAVEIKEITTCPEPYYVKVNNITSNSFTVQWQQTSNITDWEVIVVNTNDPATATPIQTLSVQNTPQATFTNLPVGKGYTVYVRAKCGTAGSFSDWSTGVTTATKIGTNDDCSGAMNLVVNPTLSCTQFTSGTLYGATASAVPAPTCNKGIVNDVWYQFTATKTIHLLRMNNIKAMASTSKIPMIYGAIYDTSCNTITAALPVFCFTAQGNDFKHMLTGLTVGQTYYIRLGGTPVKDTQGNLTPMQQPDFTFDICISSLEKMPVEIHPYDQNKYTLDHLIKDVLMETNCDVVSNINYQIGEHSGVNNREITLGYFNRGEADFPFKEGIVLATNEVQYVGRPYMGYTGMRGFSNARWIGDKDINDAIDDAGGGPREDKRVTQVEFDFIPINNTINFEYLFASNSYHNNCVEVCRTGALFTAWLIDLTTGEKQNLAKVPDSYSMPIAINTVRDAKKTKTSCGDINPEYFGDYYATPEKDYLAPVDFAGITKGMQSKKAVVIPGRKYHIKLAVMDFCTVIEHSSAVFFNAGSFDLGNIDLGQDLLIETDNAVCAEQKVILQSGFTASEELKSTISWKKDGQFITGENKAELEVSEAGEYEIIIDFPELKCSKSGKVKVEFYPTVEADINLPQPIEVCRQALQPIVVDLTQIEAQLFKTAKATLYEVSYYATKDNALAQENPIEQPTLYNLGNQPISTIVYINIKRKNTPCFEVFPLEIKPIQGTLPNQVKDVSICASYTFPALNDNQKYYSNAAGKGKEYKAGETLDTSGKHTIYILQQNTTMGCFEETSYIVDITAPVYADQFEDELLSCELYRLKPLTVNNQYYTKPGATGTLLSTGIPIYTDQTIYVYAKSPDGLCTDESSFTIKYEDCPIPKGISPNGDDINDSFDLSVHGVTSIKIFNRSGTEVYQFTGNYNNEWKGQDKSNKNLPSGTYYYVIQAFNKTRTGWIELVR